MRRGIAYVYLSLLVASAVAIGTLAVIAVYMSSPTNTRAAPEYVDLQANITGMKTVAHYCVAKASVDDAITSQPDPGYSYELTGQYAVYAKSSNRQPQRRVECYNMAKTDGSYYQKVWGIDVFVRVKPERITLTERFGGAYLDVVFRAYTLPKVYVNNSLGVADFKVKIYYKAVVTASDPSGARVLETSVPIRFAESTLRAGQTVREYPVKVNVSDDPNYDWVITTSFVLDPTGPDTYTITIDLYLFNGARDTIEVEVRW
ncbi:MAG: hypothetical protein F7C34_03390 [Desulfurococcales archaeon]|nr:hypothetical protein [Desulfurococcales archaeon]